MYKYILIILLILGVDNIKAQLRQHVYRPNKPVILMTGDKAEEIKNKRVLQTIVVNSLIFVAADIAMRKGDYVTWRKIALGGCGMFTVSFVYVTNPHKFHLKKKYRLSKY